MPRRESTAAAAAGAGQQGVAPNGNLERLFGPHCALIASKLPKRWAACSPRIKVRAAHCAEGRCFCQFASFPWPRPSCSCPSCKSLDPLCPLVLTLHIDGTGLQTNLLNTKARPAPGHSLTPRCATSPENTTSELSDHPTAMGASGLAPPSDCRSARRPPPFSILLDPSRASAYSRQPRSTPPGAGAPGDHGRPSGPAAGCTWPTGGPAVTATTS